MDARTIALFDYLRTEGRDRPVRLVDLPKPHRDVETLVQAIRHGWLEMGRMPDPASTAAPWTRGTHTVLDLPKLHVERWVRSELDINWSRLGPDIGPPERFGSVLLTPVGLRDRDAAPLPAVSARRRPAGRARPFRDRDAAPLPAVLKPSPCETAMSFYAQWRQVHPPLTDDQLYVFRRIASSPTRLSLKQICARDNQFPNLVLEENTVKDWLRSGKALRLLGVIGTQSGYYWQRPDHDADAG